MRKKIIWRYTCAALMAMVIHVLTGINEHTPKIAVYGREESFPVNKGGKKLE